MLRRMSSNLSNNPLDTVLACPAETIEPNNELNCYESEAIPEEVRNLLRKDESGKSHVKRFYVDNANINSRARVAIPEDSHKYREVPQDR